MDTYRTVKAASQIALKREGSRFIGEAFPVTDREAAEAQIEAVQAREPQATHWCTAYRVGRAGNVFRYNDDGEPSGTAGQPILRHIDGRDLTNTLVVVTRYYGGTNLGTGGLIRAYGDAADRALAAAPLVERTIRTPVRIRYAYDDTAAAQRLLQRFDAPVRNSTYTDVTEHTVHVPRSKVDAFLTAFTNALSDRGTIVAVGDNDEIG